MNPLPFHSAEQVQVLCALAAQAIPSGEKLEPCPDEQQFIAFVQGTLTEQDRASFLLHLRICPDCYREWQMVCDCLTFAPEITETLQPESTVISHSDQGLKNRFHLFLITLKNQWQHYFTFNYPRFVLGTGVLSLLLMSWLLLRLMTGSTIHQQLDEMYSELSHKHSVATQQILAEFTHPLFRPISHYGFTASPDLSTQQRAFSAGLWVGQQLLDNNDRTLLPIILQSPIETTHWLNTPWRYHYELGRWTMALWVVSQFNYDMSDQYWYRQRGLFEKIYQHFTVENKENPLAENVIAQLEQITLLLHQLPNPDTPQLYEQLGRELEILMYTLTGHV
ncbi:zf-HC2 domain-containing protein [Thioflexithrix psekupsensis]|uniref:Zinc-finger domain-containing protein n=1 Tax=Thioflexithrix psekupsensis TaxID=1570016 RepID=A0A251XC32_9GAMM|nr:zf-HC2 domain-containing protein [Thioflexithrix psekupsensis]OUD16179.1 hypothetical protein TPSD3_00170 [Thioflexithrix psekupsensis]